eukprot:359996-Chlamydomonas_euryale.AAC.1
MGRLEVTHSNCLRRIVGMKLMDRHRLGTTYEQCDTVIAGVDSSWTGPSVDGAQDDRVEQLKLRPGHRNIENFSGRHSSTIRGCHEEGSDWWQHFSGLLQVTWPHLLIPWLEIRAAVAERALDRQAWRDAIKNLAPLESMKPQQVGRMTRSCARRGESG